MLITVRGLRVKEWGQMNTLKEIFTAHANRTLISIRVHVIRLLTRHHQAFIIISRRTRMAWWNTIRVWICSARRITEKAYFKAPALHDHSVVIQSLSIQCLHGAAVGVRGWSGLGTSVRNRSQLPLDLKHLEEKKNKTNKQDPPWMQKVQHGNSTEGRCLQYRIQYFCAVYDYAGKADLSKGYWSPKRKLVVTTHFFFDNFKSVKIHNNVGHFFFPNWSLIISKNAWLHPIFFMDFDNRCWELLCPHSHKPHKEYLWISGHLP